jgi:hypothetical protein
VGLWQWYSALMGELSMNVVHRLSNVKENTLTISISLTTFLGQTLELAIPKHTLKEII